MSMRDFDFVEPASVSEACSLLAEDPEGSLVFAGGTDILVDLKADLRRPGRLVSLGRISELEGIEIGERVCINPMPDLGLFRDGAFAEYVCVKNGVRNQNVLPMPAGMSDEEGALIEPLAVALHGINRCELSADSKVLILGAGHTLNQAYPTVSF